MTFSPPSGPISNSSSKTAKPRKLRLAVWETLPLNPLFADKKTPVLVIADDAREAKNLFAAWRFFAPDEKIAYFPDWELLPFERFSPNQELISERLLTLWQIATGQIERVITTVDAAMQKLPPASFILDHSLWLKKGQELRPERLKEMLVENGYQPVSQVLAPREFAARGGIVDLFPMGAKAPYRLDFFDNEIESIRTFDPLTQRTLKQIDEIRLLAAYEFPTDKAATLTFQENFRAAFHEEKPAAEVYRAVGKGLFGSGVEFYAPLFFTEPLPSLFSYLPARTMVVTTNEIAARAARFAREIKERFTLAGGDPTHPPLPPAYLFLAAPEFLEELGHYPRLQVTVGGNGGAARVPEISVARNLAHPLTNFAQFFRESGYRALVLADSLGRAETIQALFTGEGMPLTEVSSWTQFLHAETPLGLMICPDFNTGFLLSDEKIALITESDLYRENTRRQVARSRFEPLKDGAIMDLAEMSEGDLVVHENHGIGKYLGLTTLNAGEFTEEFMLLEYQNSARLYVPVSQLNLISRYRGIPGAAIELHQLGHGSWSKAKEKALQKARDTAAELLDIYAHRALQKGFSCTVPDALYQRFVAGFAYEETPDQAAAIAAVRADLAKKEPMDRLICGDVGFGKTEVALRAAFIAAMSGRQVALLAPTTLLAEQHEETFNNRFAEFPLRLATLSRFVSGAKTKAILADLQAGKIDIVIGTHKLLQKKVQFHDLGLVIIDEEHRFGVRQKEEFKKYRSGVNVLTLTATPIPRTLAMALEQLRDFSLIATPPAKRLAIQTLVLPFSDGLIAEAVQREMKRNGQVFFLHNQVASIESMRNHLTDLLPDARICVAHGQMRERELEQVTRAFLRHQYDVMVCSTIIETGMDMPNVNTIIINHAEQFGLAQLHQLRGRVGRAAHQAYAYLLTGDYLTRDAKQRLDAIAATTQLGAGFFLARQDLEIRGGGEILGDNQSGVMSHVGLNLYSDMLKKAVAELKAGKTPTLNAKVTAGAEIKLHAPALIPEDYCPDVHERLVLYKKLAKAAKKEELEPVLEEIIDRFGLLPPPVRLLIASHELRIDAERLGIAGIEAAPEKIILTFGDTPQIDPARLLALMQKNPRLYQFVEGKKLILQIDLPELPARIARVRELLAALDAGEKGTESGA